MQYEERAGCSDGNMQETHYPDRREVFIRHAQIDVATQLFPLLITENRYKTTLESDVFFLISLEPVAGLCKIVNRSEIIKKRPCQALFCQTAQ